MRVFVEAKPSSKKEFIRKICPPSLEIQEADEMHFAVAVKEPPKNGMANEAIAKALAKHLNIAPSRIFLISGFSSKQKIFKIF